MDFSLGVFEGYLEFSRGVSEGYLELSWWCFLRLFGVIIVVFLKGVWSYHSGFSEDASSLGLPDPKFIDNGISRNVGNYLSVYTS